MSSLGLHKFSLFMDDCEDSFFSGSEESRCPAIATSSSNCCATSNPKDKEDIKFGGGQSRSQGTGSTSMSSSQVAFQVSAAEATNEEEENLSDDELLLLNKEDEIRFIGSGSDQRFSPSSSTPPNSQHHHHHHHHPHPRPHPHMGLSHEYQPKVSEEVIGHDIIIKALTNTIRRKRASPFYLFHGPGGTGKTSVARIFAMSLNCLSTTSAAAAASLRPCWACNGCSRSLYTSQLCSTNKSFGFEKIRSFLHRQNTLSSFGVFILDDNLYSSAAKSWPWKELQDIVLEQQQQQQQHQQTRCPIVFILIVEDPSMVPKAISSQCQKFSFSKLKDADIMLKLSRIVVREGIEIEKDALQLITTKAEGSMREAENLLDQLALLELKITPSIVEQLVGLVPHERLIHLLEAALSGSSTEAVRCTTDLIRFGMEPKTLISQLASLVIEILAGIRLSSVPTSQDERLIPAYPPLGIMQTERLNHVLKILIETEKQLMISPCNHATWITAAVLQINASVYCSHDVSSDNKLIAENGIGSTILNRCRPSNHIDCSELRHCQFISSTAEHLGHNVANPKKHIKCIDMEEIWYNTLERIHNKGLAEFLRCQTKLISLTLSRANAIVHLMVKHSEEIPGDITHTLKVALGCPVTAHISREPAGEQVVRRDFLAHIPEPSGHGQHKPPVLNIPKATEGLNSNTLFVSPSLDQEPAPDLKRNFRPTKFQNSMQMLVERTGHGDSSQQSQHNRIVSHHVTHSGRDNIFRNPNLDDSRKDQHLDNTSTGGTTERLLLVPSIPYRDACIEPYSQDLLFEEANNERRQGRRYSKPYKEFLKAKQDRHSMTPTELTHSWSCKERFCRDENMVNDDTMGLATNRHALNWASPCKDSIIMNSIVNKAQSDLRKTVPASTDSSL